ncbi:hypothetical protein OPIT5_06275 [Opitutaceae bacterium TAV5]|nr:hypothetical protein OPIT5_06275 [Opitutaceae bacterium TAV5]
MSSIHFCRAFFQHLWCAGIGCAPGGAARTVGMLATVIVLGAVGTGLRAADAASEDDPIPSNVSIDTSSLGNRPVTLVRILQEVEKQTDFRFVYVASDLPLKTTLLLESGNTVPLDRLLKDITVMLDVVFQRYGKIIVALPRWTSRQADAAARDRDASPVTTIIALKGRPFLSATPQLNRRFDS